MNIGERIKDLRLKMELTQEELGDRCDLTKGFISQLENNLTSPSINTLINILEALGSSPEAFFAKSQHEKLVFRKDDVFTSVNDEEGSSITWLISNAQKNDMEPILSTIAAGGVLFDEDPHIGEEFGYVIKGRIELIVAGEKHSVQKGESFYYESNLPHKIHNPYNKEAELLMVSSPPSF